MTVSLPCRIIGSCGERRRESKERRRKQREDGVYFEQEKIKVKLLSKKTLKRIEEKQQPVNNNDNLLN